MPKLTDKLKLLVGSVLLLTAISSSLFAGATAAVPEVDPGMIGSAAALLVGGYLVVVSRARRK